MIDINIETRTAKTGNRFLIKNGRPMNGYTIPDTAVTLSKLEELYAAYKTSVPYGKKGRSKYFYAKEETELTNDQLIYGANRQQAREALELTLLIGILNKTLTWPDDTIWFWQSEKDPDLVILKKWVTG